jgi:hypothetical protein
VNPTSPYAQHGPQHGHGPRSQPAQPKAPAAPPGTNPGAFGDQARRKTAGRKAPARKTKDPQIVWVRAGDLPTMLTGRLLVRGVDLHAALVRRALRRPTAAAKKAAGAAKSLITRSRTPEPTQAQDPQQVQGWKRDRARVQESRTQQGTEGMGI